MTNGSDRVVVVEVHPSEDASGPPLFNGLSAPFTLEPSGRVDVAVEVPLRPGPRLEPSLDIVQMNERGRIREPRIDVTVAARGIDSLEVARNADFTLGRSLVEVTPTSTVVDVSFSYSLFEGVDCQAVECRDGDYAVFVRGRARGLGAWSEVASVALVLDRAPPRVERFDVRYRPRSDGVVLEPDAASANTIVTISVETSEPVVVASSEVRLVDWPQPQALTPRATTEASTVITYDLAVNESAPDGFFEIAATLVDYAGNETQARGLEVGVEVRTSTPSLVVDQSAVSYVQARAGNRAAESLGTHTIPAGPYFALTAADGLPRSATLDGHAFRLADGRELVQLRIWSNAGLLLGAAQPLDGGAWRLTDLELPPSNAASILVSGIDSAGNESARQPIQRTWWVSTSNGTSTGLTTLISNATDVHEPEPASSRQWTTGLEGLDDSRAVEHGASVWRDATHREAGPEGSVALAFDRRRGDVYAFGGGQQNATSDELWRWRGYRWELVEPADGVKPPPRGGAGMAYDPVRDRLVLVGGNRVGSTNSPAPYDRYLDTWEWDGVRWSEIAAGDLEANRPGMTFDPRLGGVVLFGGFAHAGLHVLDDGVWTQMTPPQFPGSTVSTAVYVPTRGVTLGTNTNDGSPQAVWEISAQGVRRIQPSSGPSNVVSGVYDPRSDSAVFFGEGRQWSWDGASWTELGPTHGGSFSPVVYDRARRQIISRDREIDGNRFLPLLYENRVFAQTGGAFMFDANRDALLLHGQFEWRKRFWMPRSYAGHAAFDADATGTFDGSTGRAMILAPDGLWSLDNGTWVQVGPVPVDYVPGSPLHYHPTLGLVATSGSVLNRWNGTSWVAENTAGAFFAPQLGRIATDGSTNELIHTGGGARYFFSIDDIFRFDGGDWVTLPAATRPPRRLAHGMVWDVVRNAFVIFGGEMFTGNQGTRTVLADTWIGSGSSWDEVQSRGEQPPPTERVSLGYEPNEGATILATSDRVWEYAALGPPAIQFDSQLPLFFQRDDVARVHVRGRCLGRDATSSGARLRLWSTGPTTSGAWAIADVNADEPDVIDTEAWNLEWMSPTVAAARELVTLAPLRISGRCETVGDVSTDAVVEADYFEIRTLVVRP